MFKSDQLSIDLLQPKKKACLDHLLDNKWIILGIILIILLALIILIVGVSVSRKPAGEQKLYKDPVAFNTKCGAVEGSWELNHTVAVFKVSSAF